MLPQESDQLRLYRHLAYTPPRPQRQEPSCSLLRAPLPCTGHAASGVRPSQAISPLGLHATNSTTPGAQLLTFTSPSTLHRPRCLRSQTSSGYIATWLTRHQGHSARSPVAHLDEPFTDLQMDGLLLTILIDEALPINKHGRAPTIHYEEPCTALQMNGLLLQFSLMNPSHQLTWTSSYNSLPDELFPTALHDELFSTALHDELLFITWTSSYNSLPDELFPTALHDELFSTALHDELLFIHMDELLQQST